MSQGDVLKVLKKKKRFMTSKEISIILGINAGNVMRALNVLLKEGYVTRIPANISPIMFGGGSKPYKWKIK